MSISGWWNTASAKASTWVAQGQLHTACLGNGHLPRPSGAIGRDKRPVVFGALSFPRKFVFQEMGYNAPANWKEKRS